MSVNTVAVEVVICVPFRKTLYDCAPETTFHESEVCPPQIEPVLAVRIGADGICWIAGATTTTESVIVALFASVHEITKV